MKLHRSMSALAGGTTSECRGRLIALLATTVLIATPTVLVATGGAPAAASIETYNYDGCSQLQLNVPPDATSATFDLFGAQGGTVTATGGLGGRVTATIAVTPFERLTAVIGGSGNAFDVPGCNGGGAHSANRGGGTGGGGTTLRRGTTTLLVAGGGGGAGEGSSGFGAGGGAGGANGTAGAGLDGGAHGNAGGGGGGGSGTTTTGGTGGAGGTSPFPAFVGQPGTDGTPGQGGIGGDTNGNFGGGGGGGGYYGGGGGGGGANGDLGSSGGGGGGGGASYGPVGAQFDAGVRSGNGRLVVNWNTPSTLGVADPTVTEGNSGTTDAVFTVTMSPARSDVVTVDYATSDGTATAPSDYTSTSGTLTFAPGETSKTVSVPVVGDTLYEGNEFFALGITNASANASIGSQSSALGFITDDDPPPPTTTLRIGDVTIPEGNGTQNAPAKIGLRLSAPLATMHCVTFHTEDDTATGATKSTVHDQFHDYLIKTGTVKIAAGKVLGTITTTVLYDTAPENDESYTIVIDKITDSSGTSCLPDPDPNVSLADPTGVVTIRNDDPAPSTPTLDIGDTYVVEGNGNQNTAVALPLRLSSPLPTTHCVFFHTIDLTATGSRTAQIHDELHDYVTKTGVVKIAATKTVGAIATTVLFDPTSESDEAYTVVIDSISAVSGNTCAASPDPNVAIGDGTGMVTIYNDDA